MECLPYVLYPLIVVMNLYFSVIAVVEMAERFSFYGAGVVFVWFICSFFDQGLMGVFFVRPTSSSSRSRTAPTQELVASFAHQVLWEWASTLLQACVPSTSSGK